MPKVRMTLQIKMCKVMMRLLMAVMLLMKMNRFPSYLGISTMIQLFSYAIVAQNTLFSYKKGHLAPLAIAKPLSVGNYEPGGRDSVWLPWSAIHLQDNQQLLIRPLIIVFKLTLCECYCARYIFFPMT